jgi:hypothetical protein
MDEKRANEIETTRVKINHINDAIFHLESNKPTAFSYDSFFLFILEPQDRQLFISVLKGLKDKYESIFKLL